MGQNKRAQTRFKEQDLTPGIFGAASPDEVEH